MTSGPAAEAAVAAYLLQRGYELIDRNWRGPGCELDIIARKDNVIHIVEVKYRRNQSHGDGFDYITHTKRRRLRRAALAWATMARWQGDVVIDIAAVSGEQYDVDYLSDAVEQDG